MELVLLEELELWLLEELELWLELVLLEELLVWLELDCEPGLLLDFLEAGRAARLDPAARPSGGSPICSCLTFEGEGGTRRSSTGATTSGSGRSSAA